MSPCELLRVCTRLISERYRVRNLLRIEVAWARIELGHGVRHGTSGPTKFFNQDCGMPSNATEPGNASFSLAGTIDLARIMPRQYQNFVLLYYSIVGVIIMPLSSINYIFHPGIGKISALDALILKTPGNPYLAITSPNPVSFLALRNSHPIAHH